MTSARPCLLFLFAPDHPVVAGGECRMGLCPLCLEACWLPEHHHLSPQLTAINHVSNVTVNYNVTVERMHKMRGLRVSAVPPVLPPNATLVLAADVLVDSAVEVAFL